ncbi:unnamed protein product [Phytophthora fragariaefolia]|uniref:Unnamed protein product n=1 Tax=Phytophthora fragariaefolia TaxID=1490495 RepID=A0A9W7D6G9_9STRA|nr:unnamed protein product [Phytophthora fragariaefolia]
MLVAGSKDRPDYRDRMKNRCKLIIEELSPVMLKTEIKRLVSLQHREAKKGRHCFASADPRSRQMQQRYHMMDQEERAERKPNGMSDGGRAAPKPDAKRVEPKLNSTYIRSIRQLHDIFDHHLVMTWSMTHTSGLDLGYL